MCYPQEFRQFEGSLILIYHTIGSDAVEGRRGCFDRVSNLGGVRGSLGSRGVVSVESLYYYMKLKAADIIVSGPTADSDSEVVSSPLLLENGPSSAQRDKEIVNGDSYKSGGHEELDADNIKHNDAFGWSPQQMIAGKKAVDKLEGDLVMMTRRGDKYFGQMGVVVCKGVIEDDGCTLYKIWLLERLTGEPQSVFMANESLYFATIASKRRI